MAHELQVSLRLSKRDAQIMKYLKETLGESRTSVMRRALDELFHSVRIENKEAING